MASPPGEVELKMSGSTGAGDLKTGQVPDAVDPFKNDISLEQPKSDIHDEDIKDDELEEEDGQSDRTVIAKADASSLQLKQSEDEKEQAIAEEKRMNQEHVRTLKKYQTAALSAVTKKRNDISKLMKTSDNLHLVKASMGVLVDLSNKYER